MEHTAADLETLAATNADAFDALVWRLWREAIEAGRAEPGTDDSLDGALSVYEVEDGDDMVTVYQMPGDVWGIFGFDGGAWRYVEV